ncbi:MAG: twin-arginine translocase TatA/TatE family subunit [Chloroflexi bacterium]|nr:twin-arginine translocase TatA/TatE family subunit [Chloroflexota bacterium]
MDVGMPEIILILVVVVLLFGVGKIGQVGGALGKSIREFKKERDRKDDEEVPKATAGPSDA